MVRGRKKTPPPKKKPTASPSSGTQKGKPPTPSTSSLVPSTAPLDQEPQPRTTQQGQFTGQFQKNSFVLPAIPDFPSPPSSSQPPPQHFGNSHQTAPILDHYQPHMPNQHPAPFNHLSGIVLPDPIAVPAQHPGQLPSTQHNLQNYHPNPAHLQTSGGLGQHPPQVPDSAPGNYTYANLTDGIVGHIFFPLVLKKIFEYFARQQLPAAHSADHFQVLEERALELKRYGEMCGLEGACEKYASVDLFMSAMVTSLSGLHEKVDAGTIDPLLADTLSVASASFQSRTGATANFGFQNGQKAPSGLSHVAQRAGVAAGSGVVKPPGQRNLEDELGGPRRKLRPQARKCLEDWFQAHLESPYPSDAEKQALATQCQLEIQQVNNYFGNKRMRMKRKMMAVSRHANQQEREQFSKKQTGRGLSGRKANRESTLAPQSKWQAVVLSKLASPVARRALGFDPAAPRILLGENSKNEALASNGSARSGPEGQRAGFMSPLAGQSPIPAADEEHQSRQESQSHQQEAQMQTQGQSQAQQTQRRHQQLPSFPPIVGPPGASAQGPRRNPQQVDPFYCDEDAAL